MNHADEARDLLQPLQALAGKDAAFDLELAQVHATLELAEQQRISNLLTLFKEDLKKDPSRFEGDEDKILSEGFNNLFILETRQIYGKDGVVVDAEDYWEIRPEVAAALKIGDQA